MGRALRLLVSAGEASGEMYGAQLIHAFKRRLPDIEVFGVGGERMQAAGCKLVVNARDTSVVGITEIVAQANDTTDNQRLKGLSWISRTACHTTKIRRSPRDDGHKCPTSFPSEK